MCDELFKKLKASNKLPSPPGVALRILELSRSDDTSLSDLAKTISSDPALASRILKFINSPMGGSGCRVASLEEAVNRIGLRGVQLMALSFSLVAPGRMETCAGFDFKKFWSRSLATAVAAKNFAKTAGRIDPNESFIVGLLGRIGQLAMACGLPDQYEKVMRAASERPADLLSIERDVLGATHVEAGVRLLREWKLPESIWQTLEGSLDGAPTFDPGSRVSPVQVLHAANVAATLLCEPKEARQGKVEEIVSLMHQWFEIDTEAWSGLYDQIAGEWKAYGQLLSVEAGTDKSFRELQEEAQEQIATISLATQMENLGMREENRQLLQQSRLDALTGIANRASFDERLGAELDRAEKMHRTVALCMLDIDHFKRFNDTHGHQVGDQVLQLVARTLDRSIRKMDLAARYGGEEFGVIAPDCEVESVHCMAERLRKSIEAIAFNHQGQNLKITASIGVAFAEWPQHPRTAKELLKAADDRLYEAKRAGRNCCRIEPIQQRAA